VIAVVTAVYRLGLVFTTVTIAVIGVVTPGERAFRPVVVPETIAIRPVVRRPRSFVATEPVSVASAEISLFPTITIIAIRLTRTVSFTSVRATEEWFARSYKSEL
jgi:hypothetical protein